MSMWIARKDLTKHHYDLKKIFIANINLEDISDKDYEHGQKVFNEY